MKEYFVEKPMPQFGKDIYSRIPIPNEIVSEVRADAIDEFANWLPKHFDLRFSNNPKVWIDEYFNHTREKILEQLKEQK